VDWTIYRGIGIGPLRLGMSPAEVAAVLGEPENSNREFDGSVREHRTAAPILGYVDGRLTDIDAGADLRGVRFEELDVFAASPETVVRRLFDRNGGKALAGLGSVLFLSLGINTGGFYDADAGRFIAPDEDEGRDRGLAVFAAGSFDAMLDEMRPVSLPATDTRS